MRAHEARQEEVPSPQGKLHRATHSHPAASEVGFICSPMHHCSILLQSDRRQAVRLPERRRLPRKRSL
jgi:hypothetical protein